MCSCTRQGGTWATATQTKLTTDDGATSDQLGY